MAIFSKIVVKQNIKLLKSRILPSPGKVLVKIGDNVGPTAIIAKTDFLRISPRVVNLKVELNAQISPELMDSVVIKKPGDTVTTGEVIAKFQDDDTKYKKVLSPCDGVIQYISKLESKILIQEDSDSMKPMCVIPVSSILNSNPRSLRSLVTIKEGDSVKEGQVIAGFPRQDKYNMVYAPISGVIAKICPRIGSVTIVRPMETLKVHAHIPGKVVNIIPTRGAVIESFGKYIEGIFGIGGERYGQLLAMTNNSEDVLNENQIGPDVNGKIIVAGAGATFEALEKAVYFGAKGIIAGGLNQRDMARAAKIDLDFHFSCTQNPIFTMIVTEGAGFMPMNHLTWKSLKQSHGSLASIDGTTRLSGNLIRPWIFVAQTQDKNVQICDEIAQVGIESTKLHHDEINSVLPGSTVRCVREPFLGLWGVVEKIIPKRTRLESEGLMETIKIRLHDGRSVAVAKANVEVIVP